MIHTNYVPEVWKNLKLELIEDIANINLDIPLESNIRISRNLNNSIPDNLLNETPIINCDKINEKKEILKRPKRIERIESNLIHHCVIS